MTSVSRNRAYSRHWVVYGTYWTVPALPGVWMHTLFGELPVHVSIVQGTKAYGVHLSTIKLRKAGFNAAVDTRDALCSALESLNRSETPPVGKKLRARRPL